MRTIRIFEHVSIDGVVAPDGDADYANGGWTAPYRHPDGARLVADAQGDRFDLLLGRRTYDLWADYWPTATARPFAEQINRATKFVATHRPASLAWGPAEAIGDDVLAGVRRVRAADGPSLICWGSTTLTGPLLDAGLVDELVLIVYPVLLGPGKRCFPADLASRGLTIASTASTPTGVVMHTYRCGAALR